MSVRLPPTVNQIHPVQSILDEIPPEAETMEMPPEELELLAEQTMSGAPGHDAALMHAIRNWHEAEHAGDTMGASFWRRRARAIKRGARRTARGARRVARYSPAYQARRLAAQRLARLRAVQFARRRAAAARRLAARRASAAKRLAARRALAAKRFAARRAKAAARFAARQLRAVQRKLFNAFFGKLTARRARYLAAQRRRSLHPTRAESAEARAWARSYIRSKGGILGRMVTAVTAGHPMGAEPTTTSAALAIATPVLIRLMNRLLGRANKEGAPENPKMPPPEKLIPQLLFGPGDYGEPEPWGTDFSPPKSNPFGPPQGHDPYGQQETAIDPFAASPGPPAADYDPYAVSPQPPAPQPPASDPFDFSW